MIAIGVSGKRAARVANLLVQEAPKSIRVVGNVADNISAIDADSVDAVLAEVTENLGFSRTLGLARSLRTARFFRGPIFLLVPDAEANKDCELRQQFEELGQGVHACSSEWSIYADRLPVRDFSELQLFLAANLKVEPVDWRGICLIGIRELCDELMEFCLSLSPNSVINEKELRDAIESTLRVVRSSQNASPPIVAFMQQMLLAPRLYDWDCEQLMDLVAPAEAETRKCDPPLHSALHKLKGDLALPRHDQNAIQEKLQSLRQRTSGLLRIAGDWPDLLPVAQRIATALEGDLQSLPNLLFDLQQWKLARNQVEVRDSSPSPISRLVVVEDDPKWRSRLEAFVRNMNPELKVESASDVESAEIVLRKKAPAVVILDMGLPLKKGEEPDLRGGLKLLERFKKKPLANAEDERTIESAPYPHQFLILTAFGDFEDVVRDALRMNISAARYLIKSREIWSGALCAQIRLALQPPPRTLPRIEVSHRTGRVVRIDGMEIPLNHNSWSFLSVLAGAPRRFISDAMLARALSQAPYSIVPKSKTRSTRHLDEEQMLMNRFKDYKSSLAIALNKAYCRKHGMAPNLPIVERCKLDCDGYRLNATTAVTSQFDPTAQDRRLKTLVVEDNSHWQDAIIQELKRTGFDPVPASHVQQAQTLVLREAPDLICLDLELPYDQAALAAGRADTSNTLELFRFICQHCPDVGVTVLTASPWDDKIMLPLLSEGLIIEHYISKQKPNALRDLVATLHRLGQQSLSRFRIEDFDARLNNLPLHRVRFDPGNKILSHVDDRPIQVRGDRARLLKLLSENPNSFLSRDELIRALYPGSDREPRKLRQSLHNTVSRLRGDIEDQTRIPGDEIVVDEKGLICFVAGQFKTSEIIGGTDEDFTKLLVLIEFFVNL